MAKHTDSGKTTTSGFARILGAGSAGLCELVLFHPVDTISKRLMSNQTRIFLVGQSLAIGRANLEQVIFKDCAQAAPLEKVRALFPGFKFGLMFKISQRIHRFAGQLIVRDALAQRYEKLYKRKFGDKYARPMLEATAGSIIGAAEVILLPFDVLKIKSQIDPRIINGRSLVRILSEERLANLYRGTFITALRNAPGSFALFGGASLVRERIFGISDFRDASLSQTFVASIAGTTASIFVASPFDVIKTRLQNRPFTDRISAYEVFQGLRQEGISAFFKGLTPKFISVGPKLVFSFTLAQYLIVQFDIALRGSDLQSTKATLETYSNNYQYSLPKKSTNATSSLSPLLTARSQGLNETEIVSSVIGERN